VTSASESDSGRRAEVRRPAAEAEAIWKSFGRTKALQDVSVSVQPGECHALVGRNGAGKSTLVGVLTGLLKPDSGTVRLYGEPAPSLGDRAAWQERVACVYQRSMVIPSLSVGENIFLNRGESSLVRWHELRRLDPRIVTIGSHTLTHPILPSLDASQLENEVSESRRILEEKLQRPVDLFAYPNGDVNGAVHECVRKHYRAAVSVEEGWAGPLCDLHLLPRVSGAWSAVKLALSLHRPRPQPLAPGLRPIFA